MPCRARPILSKVRLIALAAIGLPLFGIWLCIPCAGSDSFTVVSARRSWSDHHQVTIQFSEPLNVPSASSPANYSIERATVQSARLGAIANTVVLTTSALDFETPPALRVDRVQNSSGTQTIAGLRIPVSLEPILPAEMGQTVNGFQDDFDTTTRAARWRSLGPDVYTQVDGILNVSAGGGDPNHLVYVDPVYAGVTQEVLARIRPAIMSDHATAFAGIALGVPTNSLTLAVRGGMNLLLENANANGGPPQRHGRLLNDYTTFGPHLSTAWTTNVWYWLRLLQHSTNAGANVFAKLWRADGDTQEPPGWQQTWKIEAGRSGYAGFRAGIRQTPAVNADYQVDYVLIKASQLPPTRPMPRAFLPDPTGTRLTIERLPANALVSWPAASGPARLEQSTNLMTWSAASEPVVSNANRFGATVALAKPAAYFRTTTLAGPPPPASFAFRFGTASSQTLTGSWPASELVTPLDSNRTQRVRTFTQPGTGFRLQIDSIDYGDFPAREWKLWFENPSLESGLAGGFTPTNSPILSNLWAGEFVLGRAHGSEFVLHYADGSTSVITDFQPRRTTLNPGTTWSFAPVGGRSSDGVMPYFNVSRPGGGCIVAVGWTGQWKASFQRDAGTNLTVRIGLEDFHLRLKPGERIRTPAVLTLNYEGDWMDGQRLLRRFLLAHYVPRPGGQPVDLPIAASGATIGFNNVTVTNQIQAITNIIAARLPVDTYWIDAGWETGGFPSGQGNHRADPIRFPKGLGPVGLCARTNGLRFLLWFEPERVMPNTWLRLNRPEWLLLPNGMPPEYAYQQNEGWRLLNLGNPAALNWAKTNFSALIRAWGVDIYRHDFNMHPLWYWRTGEASDRRGLNEIRYIMGLYDYFDSLQRDHPGLLMDNSASGGRRLDFEMGRRLVPLLRTDYLWEVVGAQAMTYGLSHWLPLIGQGGVSTENNDFRSGMGSWGTYAFDYYSPASEFWAPLKLQLTHLTTLQPYFSGDFHPLTPYSTNQTDWIAWQYHRADLNGGVVQAFRRAENLTQSLALKLRALVPDANYEVVYFERNVTNRVSGGVLMTDGLTVRISSTPEAATIRYQKK